MSRTMRVEGNENPWARAEEAIYREREAGRSPTRWKLGREVYNRLKATAGPRIRDAVQPSNQLLGLPFEVSRDAPPTLLELDSH